MSRKTVRFNLGVLIFVCMLLTACQGPGVNNNAPISSVVQIDAAVSATLTAAPQPTSVPPTAQVVSATLSPTATSAPILVASGPTGFAANINPLTGLPVSDPAILDRRPVMIKVSNFPRSGRPLAGLSSADIVFDYYIGVGTNRFLAIFYGEDAEKVGPIRSGRYVDAQFVPMYQGILGYSGAWYQIDEAIRGAIGNRAIIDAPSTCPAICTDGTVIGVFANTAEMTKYAASNGVDQARPNLDGMFFDPAIPQGGAAGNALHIQFNIANYNEWHFDAASGKYLRWSEDTDANSNLILAEATDRNTGEQMAFANVVVLFANYIQYTTVMHDISIAANTSGQRAVLFRDGKAYEAIWKSAGADRPIQFYTPDGQPLAFKPGASWIAVMGASSVVTQEPGNWAVQFSLP